MARDGRACGAPVRAAGPGARGRRARARARRDAGRRAARRGCATPSARTSIADVPVGVFLSGGVDSSLLAALAAEEARRGRSRRSRSASRSGRSTSSRWPGWSRRATAPTTTSWSCGPTPIAAAAGDRRRVRRAVRGLLGAADLRRLASSPRASVKVALSGEGGDELFGGYFTYVADVLAARSRLAAAPRPSGRWSSACRRRRAACRSTTRRKRFVARRARGRRSSATTAGRRSSRRTRGRRSSSRRRARRLRSARPLAGPLRARPRGPSRSPACRTSTSGPTSPTTCS